MMEIQPIKNPTLRDRIDLYYHLRGLKHPNATQAMLWLITELSELAAAVVATSGQPRNPDVISAYAALEVSADIAEKALTSVPGWVRNNQADGTVDLPGEIGDVLMMLDRVADTLNQPEPHACLEKKMTRKLKERKLIE